MISCLLEDETMVAHLVARLSISSFVFHDFQASLHRLLNELWLLYHKPQRASAGNQRPDQSVAAYGIPR